MSDDDKKTVQELIDALAFARNLYVREYVHACNITRANLKAAQDKVDAAIEKGRGLIGEGVPNE